MDVDFGQPIPQALSVAFQRLLMSHRVMGNILNWSEDSWNQMQKPFDGCEALLLERRNGFFE